MLAEVTTQLVVTALLVWFGFNLISAIRIAVQFRRRSRWRAIVWFVVTFLLSAIPYLAYALYCRFGWLFRPQSASGAARRAWRRCPHCGAILGRPVDTGDAAAEKCDRCGMAIEGSDLA